MGTSLIEKLVAYGASLSSTTDITYHALAGKQERTSTARPLLTDDFGALQFGLGANSPLKDAFSRLRVAAPFGVIDAKQVFDANTDQYVQQLTGGGTSTYQVNTASSLLAVTTANGDKVIRQTREYAQYQPGRGVFAIGTGTFGAPKTGVRRRLGFFDAQNGGFFEQTSAGWSVVRRTFTSGVAVDNAVAQASWNIDTLDGSGNAGNPSGVLLDPTKFNVYICEFGWLGGDVLRMGIVQHGLIHYCHVFDITSLTVPFMTTPALPIRWEIENTAGTASASDMLQTCASVFSEGGLDPRGYPGGLSDRSAAGKNVTTAAGIRPLFSIRLKSAYNRATLIPKTLAFLSNSTNGGYLSLILRPTTLTGATFALSGSTSVECDTAATVVAGGTTIGTWPVSGQVRISDEVVSSGLRMAADVAGTADVVTLALTAITGNMNGVWGGLNWVSYY